MTSATDLATSAGTSTSDACACSHHLPPSTGDQLIEKHKGLVKDAPLGFEDVALEVKRGNLNHVKRIAKEIGHECLKEYDQDGHTLMHWAAQNGSVELLQYLLDHQVPLNMPSQDNVQMHPIHWAALNGHLQAMHFFVQNGVSINLTDMVAYRTPLLLAAQYGHPLLVLYCLKNGAKVELVDIDQDSAVHWAAYKGSTEIVSICQYMGLDIGAADKYGQTPLHLAAMEGRLRTVQYLVEELDADITKLDHKERPPVALATLKKRWSVEDYLTRRSAQNRWNVLLWWSASQMPFQFVVVNLILAVFLYWWIILPTLPDQLFFVMQMIIVHVLTCVSFLITHKTDPGDCTKESLAPHEQYDQAVEELVSKATEANTSALQLHQPLCHTCHIKRPLRSKHCRICKRCISMFDHHCPFIDNCVGKNNYASFFAFITFVTIDCAMMTITMYKIWSRWHSSSWGILLAILYYAFLGLSVTGLLSMHVYLAAKNLTTNEMANLHRYTHFHSAEGGYNNPFDQGLASNILSRFCPATSAPQVLQQRHLYATVYDTEEDATELDAMIV